MIGRDPAPAWLVAAPIAHRGLHDRRASRIENSLAAAAAAMSHRFAIECDVQRAADGEAVVFHDTDLRRLTGRCGTIHDLTGGEAAATPLDGTTDRIPSLATLLDLVAGQVPVICEIKSRFDGDLRLADRVADIVRAYGGPLAIKSFDPAVIRHLRQRDEGRPLGIVSEACFEGDEWVDLGPAFRADLAALTHFSETRPDFLSFAVDDLPHAAPSLCRAGLGLPVMTWTVRDAEQRQKAAAFADQMVFEGFLP
ncbi:MAG TPA: glycerophosphodiester phosphodiesterase family protein [Lichenihabitans sp.]|jgi:glycerophosphoryl diester phosphodiesterase|nr:glycerophosphodiester phosphodiesterase family protein [Lichenihabitans sp.]